MTSDGLVRLLAALCAVAAIAVPARVVAQTGAKPPAKPAAGPLGRMFFTPAQRASLDIARTRRAQTTLSTDRPEESAAAAPVAQSVTYDGVVRRSDGKSTIWFNGRPFTENEQISGPVVGRVRPDGSVSLQLPQSGRRVELKVGQTVELVSGTIEEPYGRKPAAAAPEAKPAAKPAPESKGTKPASPDDARAERDREDRQRDLENNVRALQEAAAKAGTPSAAPPEGPAR